MATNRRAAMLATMRQAEQLYENHREIHGAFMQHGKQCVCSGICAIRLDSPIANLPETNYSGPLLDEKFSEEGSRYLVTIPDPCAMKSGETVVLVAGDIKVGVNSKYLLRMYQALGPSLTASVKSPTSAILFSGKHGDGIVMPIRLGK